MLKEHLTTGTCSIIWIETLSLLLCAHCMDCVHSVVWYVEDESYVVASYKADTILSTTSYLLQTNMWWNLYMLHSLVYWKEEYVYALVFSCFLKTQMLNLLVFCCKNMSTHSFVSFRNISILSLICLSSCFFLSLFMCLYIPGFSKAQFYGLILEAFASLVVNVIDI